MLKWRVIKDRKLLNTNDANKYRLISISTSATSPKATSSFAATPASTMASPSSMMSSPVMTSSEWTAPKSTKASSSKAAESAVGWSKGGYSAIGVWASAIVAVWADDGVVIISTIASGSTVVGWAVIRI